MACRNTFILYERRNLLGDRGLAYQIEREGEEGDSTPSMVVSSFNQQLSVVGFAKMVQVHMGRIKLGARPGEAQAQIIRPIWII